MNEKYAVITRERMTSEFDGTKRVPVKIDIELENGSVVVIGDLEDNEREVYSTTKPSANTQLCDIAILTSPEVIADERKKNLSDFINPVNKPATADILSPKDIFSLTKEGFEGEPAVGKYAVLGDSYKLQIADDTSSGATIIGKIIDLVNGKYAIRVTD